MTSNNTIFPSFMLFTLKMSFIFPILRKKESRTVSNVCASFPDMLTKEKTIVKRGGGGLGGDDVVFQENFSGLNNY